MNPLDRLKEAEASGMPVTLDPSEISFLTDHVAQLQADYITATQRFDRLRYVALEARDALRGYNHQSPVAERLTRVCRGEEL